MKHVRFLKICASLLGLLLFMPFARAQENADIIGTTTDPSGAVIPNASVKLVNTETNDTRSGVTNGSGIFNFTALRIGHYTLTVSAPGFKVSSTTGIVLNVAQTLQQNIVLEVGSTGQTVSVQADALQVQSETSQVDSLISGAQVSELATNGRNITALAVLGLGVSNNLPDYNGVMALTAGNGISFNGTRPGHNIYLVDGGEIYDRGCGGCFSILVSQDSIAQFQTLTSNYSPDYGIGSGGQILMVLKSGTRDYHGGLWEFNRNEAFDANNYISKMNGQKKPELRVNVFGGNIGGPLFIPHLYNNARNRTFFFVNEEDRRNIQGSAPSSVNTILASNFPTAGQDLTYTPLPNNTAPIVPGTKDPAKLALYAQDGLTAGQAFPGNIIPANLIDSNVVAMLNTGVFPKPNASNGGNQFSTSVSAPTYVREDLVRIDHTINEKLQLMGNYIHDANSQTLFPPLWSDDSYPTVGSVMQNPAWAAVVKLTQTLSPNLLNETAFNFDGNKLTITPTGNYAAPSDFSTQTFFTGNNPLNRLPEIDLGAPYSTNWSSSYYPWKNAAMDFQTRDDLSWTIGRHSLKFGASWMHFIKNQQLQSNTQGTYAFNNSSFSNDSYVNFLLGDAATFTQLQALNGLHWVNNSYSGYAQDNWKILKNLTLNLGLRYDALPHNYERFNKFANFVPADYSAANLQKPAADGTLNPNGPGFVTAAGISTPFYLNGIQLAGVDGFPRGGVKNDYGSLQPRIGFALDPYGDGKTVIRGGFGLFFERIQGNDSYDAGGNPPFSYQPSSNNVYFSNTTQSATTGVIASPDPFPASITNLAYNYPLPGVAMFSLGVQQEVAPAVIAVLQYVGTTSWHQSDDRAINTLPLNSPYRESVAAGTVVTNQYRQYLGYAGITQEEQTTNSSYHSLQAGLRAENKHGLTVQLSYTWSHEIDVANGDLTTLSNPFNVGYDRGSGSLDRRHIFSANYIYDLPFFKHSSNALEREALSGWQVSGITIANSGIPEAITYATDTIGLGGGTTNRANLVSGTSTIGPKSFAEYFNKAAFSAPIAAWSSGATQGVNAGFGNSGKDKVVGPGRFNTNLALFKSFPLHGENLRLQIRAESFNTFNHTQFQNIDTGFLDSNFGQVTSTWDARKFQFGGKLLF
ncbi:TonB-dependent receptor [Granulicella arctica]|uniref:TonB-dependent transporter Oar-like beta-barrel domain-containing protein n=1 Tax=Granulicella arctica TaxID=940613 RepID=A0A7Y9PDG9_9BACT|nr:TonB-dependent receptor [Granulicella arctica]NYF77792.1 hypothetical protein [Granulicella arctica]